MKCEYCGNRSGKTDDKGMCISCGGPVKVKRQEMPTYAPPGMFFASTDCSFKPEVYTKYVEEEEE